MYEETVQKIVETGVKKRDFLFDNLLGYVVSSGLSGMYIGFGIVLIFSIGAPFAAVDSAVVRLVMGASFGVALTLVIFAGCELYTSNVMFMIMSWAKRKVNLRDASRVWIISWCGALVGSLLFAYMVVLGNSVGHSYGLLADITEIKMTASAHELFFRAILCNMLVCLAVWICMRTKSDAAKIMVIFWCLFAFIGAGYEHSVANMSLMAMALLSSATSEVITWGGYAYNLLWVTLGNFVGGAVFISGAYLVVSRDTSLEETSELESRIVSKI